MNKKDIKEFLPLGFISIVSVITLITITTSNYTIDVKQYIGLSLLAFSILLFFLNRKLYKYFFGIILLLATVTPISFSFWIAGITLIIFKIYLIPSIGLGIYFLTFRREIIHILFNSLQQDPEEKRINTDAKVKRFKRQFSELNDQDLDRKLEQDLVPEAKKAIIEIKKNRE